MKKILILMLAVFVGVGTYSQNTERSSKSDKMVPAEYKTNQVQHLQEINVQSRSEIVHFIENEIEYPETSFEISEEGEVVVEFVVTKDGNISNINITNSVSPTLDNTVVDCLNKTHGSWTPATIDGEPIESRQSIHVVFDIPGNTPLIERARDKFDAALKYYYRAEAIESSTFISEDKRSKKANRNYNLALNLLEDASKLKADESAITYWTAKTYEGLGDMSMMQSKIDELNAIKASKGDKEDELIVQIGY